MKNLPLSHHTFCGVHGVHCMQNDWLYLMIAKKKEKKSDFFSNIYIG